MSVIHGLILETADFLSDLAEPYHFLSVHSNFGLKISPTLRFLTTELEIGQW